MTLLLTQGNALTIPLADESVHCVVTSPPYWGLRDYGIGDQLGLEPTPEEYVANMVAVFREIKRVLRADGTCWLNLGDSYWGGGRGGNEPMTSENWKPEYGHPSWKHSNLKPKDLCGIPWRVAFALQADGWWLRSDIIWNKTNSMPEPVRDRLTKGHEYVFLLSKSLKYFYDVDAIREPHETLEIEMKRKDFFDIQNYDGNQDKAKIAGVGKIRKGRSRKDDFNSNGCNKRTVWTLPTKPYKGAHFATFPPKLIEPCIKAGTSEHGVCPKCGSHWERVVERGNSEHHCRPGCSCQASKQTEQDWSEGWQKYGNYQNTAIATNRWQPTCECWRDMPDPDAPRTKDARKRQQQDAGGYWKYRAVLRFGDTLPATVFDPFVGSGTTCLVSEQLGRNSIGVDLSLEYLNLAQERTGLKQWMRWVDGKKKEIVINKEGKIPEQQIIWDL